MKSEKSAFSIGFATKFHETKALFAAQKAKISKKTAKSARISSFKNAFSTSYKQSLRCTVSNKALRPALIGAFSVLLGVFIGTYVIPINNTSANSHIDVPADAISTQHSQLETKSPAEKHEQKTISAAQAKSSGYAAASNTQPSYSGAGLSIPSLGIATSVSASTLSGNELSVPSSSVSSYGTLLMGHSSGVFRNLPAASVGQEIIYNGQTYIINKVKLNLPVAQDRKSVGNYSMYVLTNYGPGNIVLMTCAGSYQPGFGYTARTLVFASLK